MLLLPASSDVPDAEDVSLRLVQLPLPVLLALLVIIIFQWLSDREECLEELVVLLLMLPRPVGV